MNTFEFPTRPANDDSAPTSENTPSLKQLAQEAGMTPEEYRAVYDKKNNISDENRYAYYNDANPEAPGFTPNPAIHDTIVSESQAFTDALTGLFNRRAFDIFLEDHASLNEQREQKPYILFIDFDDFKSVNELPGAHATGDTALQHIANIVKSSLRKDSNDTAYRYGGDEFTVVLYTKSSSEALSVAERIRRNVEAHPFFYDDAGEQKPRYLTVSIGMAPVQNSASTAEQQADIAAEASKNAGKNRIYYFPKEQESKPIPFE